MYGCYRIVAFILFFVSIGIGGYFADDLGLGNDIGYIIGFVIGLILYFVITRGFQSLNEATKRQPKPYTDVVGNNRIRSAPSYRETDTGQKVGCEEHSFGTLDSKECPFCAETIKAKAIVCRYCGRDLPKAESEEVSQKVVEYYKAIQGILTEHVIETGTTGETLNRLMLVDSSEARMKEQRTYNDRLEAAKRRLQKVKDLNPPNEILAIHQTYIKAFTFGVEARREESRGNHFKASAAYQISSDELSKTVKMWEELGVT